jgi:hypothetical protein
MGLLICSEKRKNDAELWFFDGQGLPVEERFKKFG